MYGLSWNMRSQQEIGIRQVHFASIQPVPKTSMVIFSYICSICFQRVGHLSCEKTSELLCFLHCGINSATYSWDKRHKCVRMWGTAWHTWLSIREKSLNCWMCETWLRNRGIGLKQLRSYIDLMSGICLVTLGPWFMVQKFGDTLDWMRHQRWSLFLLQCVFC